MHLPAWTVVLLAIPVLLLGEVLARRVPLFARFNIPAPVIGGLLISLVFLLCHLTASWPVQLDTKVSARWWTWLVSTEPEWATSPVKTVHLPMLVGFFTCIGLNA
ncbi:MAG TPA: sodium/glutamate symporter, partial [Clostridia bacterium]|nr:sodium/glutamate symporter [Clostridia bacterium]